MTKEEKNALEGSLWKGQAVSEKEESKDGKKGLRLPALVKELDMVSVLDNITGPRRAQKKASGWEVLRSGGVSSFRGRRNKERTRGKGVGGL